MAPKPRHVSSANFNNLAHGTHELHIFVEAHQGIPQPWPLDLLRFHLQSMGRSGSAEMRGGFKTRKTPWPLLQSQWSIPARPSHHHHHHHHRYHHAEAVRISCPYLMFKKPRILQCVRMHQLSCSVVCCAVTLVRVCHSPRSRAVQTPAGPLTPCLPASDALLLCQATVICDWASIGRTTALSPAQIIAVTSSLLPGSILIDATLSIPLLALRLSHGKGHGRSDQLVQVVFSAAETLNERHRDRDMLNSPNSGVQLMIQN